MRFVIAIAMPAILVLACALVAAPSADKPAKAKENRWVVIETSKGTIKFVLYEKEMPITAQNFIGLVDKKFFDELKFHRVEDWVVQGGDPTGTGRGGSGKTIKLETKPQLNFDKPYAVGMARQPGDRDSATSQFFITKKTSPFLNGDYAMFGQVVEGQSVVEKLEKGDIMKTVRIVDAPSHKPAPKKK
jgi:peptidyl-prolyl cis-trans isomerase B (cyclophilin B)